MVLIPPIKARVVSSSDRIMSNHRHLLFETPRILLYKRQDHDVMIDFSMGINTNCYVSMFRSSAVLPSDFTWRVNPKKYHVPKCKLYFHEYVTDKI